MIDYNTYIFIFTDSSGYGQRGGGYGGNTQASGGSVY